MIPTGKMIPKMEPKKKIQMVIRFIPESEYISLKKSSGSFIEEDSFKYIVVTVNSLVF